MLLLLVPIVLGLLWRYWLHLGVLVSGGQALLSHLLDVRDVLDALEGVTLAHLLCPLFAVRVNVRALVSFQGCFPEFVAVSILEPFKIFPRNVRLRDRIDISFKLHLLHFLQLLIPTFFRASCFLRSGPLAPWLVAYWDIENKAGCFDFRLHWVPCYHQIYLMELLVLSCFQHVL